MQTPAESLQECRNSRSSFLIAVLRFSLRSESTRLLPGRTWSGPELPARGGLPEREATCCRHASTASPTLDFHQVAAAAPTAPPVETSPVVDPSSLTWFLCRHGGAPTGRSRQRGRVLPPSASVQAAVPSVGTRTRDDRPGVPLPDLATAPPAGRPARPVRQPVQQRAGGRRILLVHLPAEIKHFN